jgi:hypothetical protein
MKFGLDVSIAGKYYYNPRTLADLAAEAEQANWDGFFVQDYMYRRATQSGECFVPDRILQQMCERIRTRQYVMTLHAEEEMEDDGLTVFDVERGILTGEIVERQRDHDTGELKYVVSGRTVTGNAIGVVTKFSPTRKLVIITVHLEQ